MKTLTEELVDQLDQELKLGLKRDLYRSSFAVGLDSSPAPNVRNGVDRESRTIFGVAVATDGPALGHQMDIDRTFLEQLVTAGNQAKQGIKARFDHPNASSTSMGTAIGRFKQFRKTGAIVRADLHLLKSAELAPEGNYPEYIMELALEDPQSFGTSIVFSGKPEYILEADGTRKKGGDGKPLNPRARLEKLYAADVVDEPAANPGGFFHALSHDSLAAKITAFLDRYFAQKGILAAPQAVARQELGEKAWLPPKDLNAMTDEERETHWRTEYNASPTLQHEFLEVGIYLAFRMNERRTKIPGGLRLSWQHS